MADIVNLRRARKDKARQERAAEADAKRRQFGRTKVQKALEEGSKARAEREVDGKRLDRD